MDEQKVEIKGVAVIFQFSISINTITSQKPTPFAMNYLKTLGDLAGKELSEQVGAAMIEKVNEDFNKYPNEELWEKGKLWMTLVNLYPGRLYQRRVIGPSTRIKTERRLIMSAHTALKRMKKPRINGK